MVKFYKEYKEQALLLSQWYMSEKGCRAPENQLLHDCRVEKGEKQKSEGSEDPSDKTPLNERELAMQQEIQELKKRS